MSKRLLYEDQEVFDQLRNKDIFFVFSEDKDLYNLEEVTVINKQTGDELIAKITSKECFKNVDNAFNVIPYTMFLTRFNEEETKQYFRKKFSDMKVYVYRMNVKNETSFCCDDVKLNNMIDLNTLHPITNGHSVCDVYSVLKKDGKKCILKIQRLNAISGIDKEYEKFIWLDGKVRCPKVYYYNENDDYKILLREEFVGKPLFEFQNFGEKLGKILKHFHSIPVEECPFTSEKIENLILRVNNSADGILEGIKEKYSEETSESIIEFMKSTKLTNDSVVHGDCSLSNILVSADGEYCFIDVADLSVSSKYYDLYYLLMSLKMNNKISEIDGFFKGYGIDHLDKDGLKFMEFVDKTFY